MKNLFVTRFLSMTHKSKTKHHSPSYSNTKSTTTLKTIVLEMFVRVMFVLPSQRAVCCGQIFIPSISVEYASRTKRTIQNTTQWLRLLSAIYHAVY